MATAGTSAQLEPNLPALIREQLKRVWKADVDQALGTLATYDSERARGLVHTPDWVERMAALQREVCANRCS